MEYKEAARLARRKVLGMVHKAGTSHIASNFSVIDIATVLYANLKEEDEVVWSAGWKAATIYYFLAQQGKIPEADLALFPNPPYLGLAETSVNGVLCNGGSVGHGTAIACGIALAKKRSNTPGTVYCILSDGELNEGTVWESAMFAAHHQLNNLVFIVDVNKWQAMGRTSDVIDLEPIEYRFYGFGWLWRRAGGHSYVLLDNFFQEVAPKISKPTVLICDTIKGKGVSFMEDHLTYHYKHVSDEDYKKALEELS